MGGVDDVRRLKQSGLAKMQNDCESFRKNLLSRESGAASLRIRKAISRLRTS